MFCTILFGLVVIFTIKWIWDRKKSQRTFIEMGLPGPKPEFLFGNFKTITQQGFYTSMDNWLKQYGKTFGYFEGGVPVLVTTDLNIAKQVLIKDFNKFHSRQDMFTQPYFSKHTNMFLSNGDTWKRLRSISSPTFSASKMKEMSPLVNNCIDNFLKLLLPSLCNGKPFNVHSEYQRLTVDVISNCAFGIDTNCIQDNNSTFLKKGRASFTAFAKPGSYAKVMFLIKMLFPTFHKVLTSAISFVMPNTNSDYFHALARSVISQRKQDSSVNRVDFVQLMINATESGLKTDQMEVNLDKDDDDSASTGKKTQVTAAGKGMTLEEMESQSLVFMLAGFETTSTTLGYMSYQLALNPDVQDKLRQEVDEHFPDGSKKQPDYISVQKLEYMDMVLKETLRFHTPASRAVNRDCTEATVVEGLHIPKGTNMFVYNHGIHMDPNIWGPETPDQFVPERFSQERKGEFDPFAWMPFGAGPRNCIGMRFALLEVKIAMARILKHFVIHKCEKTKIPLPVSKIAFRSPTEGIYLTMSQRL